MDYQKTYWYFIRFYADGEIINTFADRKSEIESTIKKLNKNNRYISKGMYKIENNIIKFLTIDFKGGEVEYEGEVISDVLVLNFYSHINGNRGTRNYKYLQR